MASKVYFTDFCTGTSETLPQKLARLCLSAGMDRIDFKDKFVAIKIHFGELGNMAHLRSGYARVIVDLVKDLGGKPFLTDANTMYVGSRKNAHRCHLHGRNRLLRAEDHPAPAVQRAGAGRGRQ